MKHQVFNIWPWKQKETYLIYQINLHGNWTKNSHQNKLPWSIIFDIRFVTKFVLAKLCKYWVISWHSFVEGLRKSTVSFFVFCYFKSHIKLPWPHWNETLIQSSCRFVILKLTSKWNFSQVIMIVQDNNKNKKCLC